MRFIFLFLTCVLTSFAHASNTLPTLIDELYGRYVVEVPSPSFDTRVNYKMLRKDLRNKKSARELFSAIETQIAHFDKTGLNKNELTAFYINAYNFLTIKLILDNYRKFLVRLPSIVLIDLNTEGPWMNHFFQVAGESVSLDDIEHRILREEILNFKDGRIHFALNCASRGCPPLLNKSYKAETLDQQLNQVTSSGLKLPRMVRITKDGAALSSIFDWFLGDFENERGSVANFVSHYSGNALVIGEAIEYQKYDWCLNNYLRRSTLSDVLGVNLRICSLI